MRRAQTWMMIAGALAAAAGQAMADGTIKVTDPTNAYNGTDSSGGAFIVNQVSGDNGFLGDLGLSATTGGTDNKGSFYTFCIERSETFTFNTLYYTQIADSARGGGGGAIGTGATAYDPLVGVTAKLYSTFRCGGSFGGTIGVIDTAIESTAMQNAIWFSEGEKTWAELDANAQYLYNWAKTNSDGGLHGVRVLRLWTTLSNGVYSGASQDFLTLIPLPPAAYAGMGTFAGMLGFAAIRRRQHAAA